MLDPQHSCIFNETLSSTLNKTCYTDQQWWVSCMWSQEFFQLMIQQRILQTKKKIKLFLIFFSKKLD